MKKPNSSNPVKKKKEKKNESESKVAAGGSLGVCIITKMPLKTELWKLKTLKIEHSKDEKRKKK